MAKIEKQEIRDAYQTLQKYKSGKKSLEENIVNEEKFWKGRHWDAVQRKDGQKTAPTSAWMFNSIVNKHADAMDSYPEAICLPREASDEENAKILTSVIPVTLERNDFEKTYSDNWWYKLKHGTCATGVFWDSSANDGKGDVAIKKIDLLNLIWEPGITDIQKSRNLFILDLVSVDILKERYPKLDIKGGETADLKQYVFDDAIDTSDKALVIDWYYKKEGKLHYCKFCEENILFASENEKGYENGWYEDGEYPVAIDVLYPEEGTIYGFGIISITKDPQLYIDKLDESFMNHSHIASKPRYFSSDSAGVNEEEFLDLSKPIVHVSGNVDENRLKPIQVYNIPGYMMNFRQAKIDELKETSSNRDFSQGSTSGGVTSGAAIAVLQEAGNKTSRDMINASYRTFEKIVHMMIERFRQFYTHEHTFRITGETGVNEFVAFDNSGLVPQPIATVGEEELFRKPIFDIDVKTQKQNPFSTLAQNETAMNLYNSGLLAPENAQVAMIVLDMMTFEGKEEVIRYVKEGQTLQNQLMQMQQQNQQLMQQLEMMQGGVPGAPTMM
jgi:DNA-binding ferritin-like protein